MPKVVTISSKQKLRKKRITSISRTGAGRQFKAVKTDYAPEASGAGSSSRISPSIVTELRTRNLISYRARRAARRWQLLSAILNNHVRKPAFPLNPNSARKARKRDYCACGLRILIVIRPAMTAADDISAITIQQNSGGGVPTRFSALDRVDQTQMIQPRQRLFEQMVAHDRSLSN
jgi:hypothetical protein